MIGVNQVISSVRQRFKGLAVGEGLVVKTYKRDRGFSLRLLADEMVEIKEFGFVEQVRTVELARLAKELKVMVKREFPRSNKVWLQRL
ncbi:MAG: hypothetical protein ABFR97_09065 [Thermodesulfobacteriota bacterium]